MIVDGKQIADTVCTSIKLVTATLTKPPILVAVTCAPNFETRKYLALKKRKAQAVGIVLVVVELDENLSQTEAEACIREYAITADGIVVQLPFPPKFDREALLAAIPVEKDPDGFSYGTVPGACLPPVAGAIKEIATTYDISVSGKQVVILGHGRLVGQPVAHFMRSMGAHVTVYEAYDPAQLQALQSADVIVTGIGRTQFVTRDMVKSGVLIFDAGASEDGGVVAGDVHPEVASVAALFTPVPGGIGPITVALLLRNLMSLVRQ